MERRALVAAAGDTGKTVQRFLHEALAVSHARARGILLARLVRINRILVVRPDVRLAAGDRVELLHDPERHYRAPRRTRGGDGYRLVHEEGHLVVVDKEAGLITVPSPSHGGESLVEKLTEVYRRRGFRDPRVRAVHRIDRFTSGLVVLARAGPTFESLRAQFASGKPERVYLAVAEGSVAPERGRLVHHLAEHPESLKVHTVSDPRRGRRASCSFRVLERFRHATLLEVRLETGRRNQIRVQLAAEGHPLVGDSSYGERSALVSRTALHALRLTFEHPQRGEKLVFEAPPPEDFRRLLVALRGGASPRAEAATTRERRRAQSGPIRPPRAPGPRYRSRGG